MSSLQKIDALTLRHLADELHRMLLGARVSRIAHPNVKEFIISFWGHDYDAQNRHIPRGDLNQLYINLHPEFCYALLLAPGEKDQLVKPTLHHPTATCMLLRKHLGNAKVIDVISLPEERVLNLTFENFNELGNRVVLVLSIELMGKHSNMILYDDLQRDIMAISHSVSEQMSRYREMTVGSLYAIPPTDLSNNRESTGYDKTISTPIQEKSIPKRPLQNISPSEFSALFSAAFDTTPFDSQPIEAWVADCASWMVKRFSGLGNILTSHIMRTVLKNLQNPESKKSDPREKSDPWKNFALLFYEQFLQLRAIQNTVPSISDDRRTFSLLAIDGGQSHSSIHDMLRAYYLPNSNQRQCELHAKRLLAVVDAAEKRRVKRELSLTPMPGKEIEALQQTGHLILAQSSMGHLPAKPGQGNIVLEDFYTGQPVTLSVDPSLNWADNAALYYRRAKKGKARQAQYEKQKEALDQERQFLAELRILIEQSDRLVDLQAIEDDLVSQELMRSSHILQGKQKKQPQKTGSGILCLTLDQDGVQILVGRSSQANGNIVSKEGRAQDWWFHVHQMPGSHVLVKLAGQEENKGKTISNDLILQAANLAVYFSGGRDGKNVPVIYTQLRHVRKIPGTYPGHVTYKQEQTVFISVDEALIKKLL